MKKTFLCPITALAFLFLCGGCHEQKKTDVIIANKPVVKKPQGTQKMGEYSQNRTVKWLGTDYEVQLKREADASLELVHLDDGGSFFDNRITVRVLRQDGSEFFNKTFTKDYFSSYLDEDTKKHGALLGIVYMKAEGDYLVFAASVGSPDATSDEYVPMILKISRMGTISVSKDTLMDTGDNDDGEDDV